MKFLYFNLKINLPIFVTLLKYYFVFCVITSYSVIAAQNTEQSLTIDLLKLDSRFKKLSAKIYKNTTKTNAALKFSAITQLNNSVNSFIDQADIFLAISTIRMNLSLVDENINEPIVLDFIKLLLKHNEYITAKRLIEKINDEGDEFIIAKAAILLASYHSQRNEWREVLPILNIELGELSDESYSRASILKGTALQNLSNHRVAIKIYEGIPISSRDYQKAQLNIAVGHIRQDWWTDAQIIMNKLLKNDQKLRESELGNRLYLMLGYLLLNKEFFRESRESFRSISLDSKYTNKALMGISLVAISQNDYSGAINTLSLLKNKTLKSLVVEESYLLLPHAYKMLEQYQTANDSYTDAVDYYQKRINQLNGIISNKKYHTLSNISLTNQSEFVIADSIFNINEDYPKHFVANFIELSKLSPHTKTSSLSSEANNLLKDYSYNFDRVIKELVKKRISQLESYASQSRYSLVKLYDVNNEQK